MIKSIIFDISGVVTFDNYHQIYANFAERVGLPPEFIPGYFKENWTDLLLNNITLEQIFETFKNKEDKSGNAGYDCPNEKKLHGRSTVQFNTAPQDGGRSFKDLRTF